MIAWFKSKKDKSELADVQVIFFTISNLMLSRFIDIVCESNFRLLVKEGNPTDSEVIEKWDALFLNYSDIIGSSDYEVALSTEKTVAEMKGRITVVSTIMETLVGNSSEPGVFINDFAQLLNNEYGFNIQYYADEETYYKQFKAVQGQLKLWSTELDIMRLKKPSEGQSIDREMFDNIRIELSSFIGYPVRENDTTVSEFALMIKRLRKHNEALEKQYEKSKRSV